MKTRLILQFLTFVLLAVHANAQDVAVEQRFLAERSRLKQNKIFQISERDCPHIRELDCRATNSDLRYEYFFDDEGYLKTIKQYQENSVNVTVYVPDHKGGYQSKTYKYYDTDAKLMYTSYWLFDFDDRGRIVKERLQGDNATLRINVLEYDENGNLKSKTTDSIYRWTQTYDQMHRLVEQREWRSPPRNVVAIPDFRCISITTYTYQGEELVRKIVRGAESQEIWEDDLYKYDSNRYLVEIGKNQTHWKSENGGPSIAEIYTSRSLFWNDKFGMPLRNCTVSKSDTTIRNCVFYTYNSNHLTDSTFDFVRVDSKKVERLIKKIKKHPEWKPFFGLKKIDLNLLVYSYPKSIVRGNTFFIWAKTDEEFVMVYQVDSKTYKILNWPPAVNDLR